MRIRSTLMAMAVGPLLCGIVQAADIGPALSAADIERILIGNKEWFVAPDGRTQGGIYNQDGSYLYGDGSGGTWRMDGDKFCDKPSGQPEDCGTFHRLSDKTYQFIRADGSKGFVIKIP